MRWNRVNAGFSVFVPAGGLQTRSNLRPTGQGTPRQGPTTVLPSQKTTEFIKSIDTKRVVGLRDRALIGVMIYALARISAVMGLTVEDFLPLQNAG